MLDSPFSIISHAVNFALATVGGANRAETQPLVPIIASAATLPAAATSARYLFYQMPVVEKGWCPYCMTDAAIAPKPNWPRGMVLVVHRSTGWQEQAQPADSQDKNKAAGANPSTQATAQNSHTAVDINSP